MLLAFLSINLLLNPTELHKGSSFVVKLVSELAIRDGGHCLHVFGNRLFSCKVSVAYLFRIGVGGSDRWFGTSVEDTVKLPRSQGSLPVKPEALKLTCVLVSDKTHTQLQFFPQDMLTSSHLNT